MSSHIVLDAGPLGIVTNPRESEASRACKAWLRRQLLGGVRVLIPEIADYEVRRELIRAGRLQGVARLDDLEFLPIDTKVMRLAARIWAEARQRGFPTADDKALDADVILAAQANLAASDGQSVVVATTNPGHLARFVADARPWSMIPAPGSPCMKTNPVKKALREGMPQVGTWLSLGSVVGARFLARSGLPWLTVDLEHTHTDINTAALMFGAIADAGCVPLARVQTGRHDLIKAVLDCGAMGIVAPMVMHAAEARAIVSATKYPPKGDRSLGGGLHALNYGATAEDYYQKADDEILVVIQTEHIAAVEVADETYAVPGVDAVFVGPNDLAASLRGPDGSPPSKALMEQTLTRIREAAARQGIASGLHVFSLDDARRRLEEGWRFIAVNSELKFMMQGAAEVSKAFASGGNPSDVAKY